MRLYVTVYVMRVKECLLKGKKIVHVLAIWVKGQPGKMVAAVTFSQMLGQSCTECQVFCDVDFANQG